MVAVLIERMQSNPDDLKGWSILARSLYVMNRYGEAVPAYRNVLRLGGGNDAGTLADFADALVATNNGQFNEESGNLLLKALELDPNHIKALWLAGHWQVEAGDNARALRYWEQAVSLMPPTTEDYRIIQQQIGDIRARAGLPASEPPVTVADTKPAETATAETAAATGLSVTVKLDPALRERAAPNDTVFIFARAADGPRMPLAIVRKQVRELPVTVTLDDSMAMAPGMVMSNFAELTVGARVSRSGNAMPQSGDLQGSQSPVQLAQTDRVDILIDSVTP
jgi:cytochrome c-type biogenesis protein CcmH